MVGVAGGVVAVSEGVTGGVSVVVGNWVAVSIGVAEAVTVAV